MNKQTNLGLRRLGYTKFIFFKKKLKQNGNGKYKERRTKEFKGTFRF